MPQAKVATHDKVFRFITGNALFGLGIGYVDAHLPAAALWTRDKRLLAAAARIDLATLSVH